MRRLFQYAAALLVSATTATTAQAAGVLYDCDITKKQKKVEWISPKLILIFPEKGQPQVYDSIVLHFYGKPVPVKVTRRGDNLMARWTLKGVRDDQQQLAPHFDYSAKINTKTTGVHVTANPVSYPNRWTGRGTCKTRKP